MISMRGCESVMRQNALAGAGNQNPKFEYRNSKENPKRL